jgi:NCAIR mutase (PurE)-related protein
MDVLFDADAVVAVAGMDGALPGVVAGIASCPVVAVPTSVGYGVAMNGIGPLITMLNSCALGVSVVNIDNGLGAGYTAALIASRRSSTQPEGV